MEPVYFTEAKLVVKHDLGGSRSKSEFCFINSLVNLTEHRRNTLVIEIKNGNQIISRKENVTFSTERTISIEDIKTSMIGLILNDTGDAINFILNSKKLWICELHIYGIPRKQKLLLNKEKN
jgi:hypothetical protein